MLVLQHHDRVRGPRGLGRIACDRIVTRAGRPPGCSSVEYVIVDYDGDIGIYAEPVCLVTKIEEPV